jgi:hypothetical protein
MNNELMVLLGCGLAAYAVTNACTSIYEKAEESDSEDEYEGFSCGGYHEEGYGGCGSSYTEEKAVEGYAKPTCKYRNELNFFANGGRNGDFKEFEQWRKSKKLTYEQVFSTKECRQHAINILNVDYFKNIIRDIDNKEKKKDKFAIDYFQEPVSAPPAPQQQVSPLMFGTMVSNEPYIESDYIEMKDYTANPDGIKVYNEKDDTIGLPVTDMTDVSAGENNKYIYDRTIGTIGFTSTKIGGRFRGQADYIRGDLGIVPDKTGWFQVPSDPANKLMVGAINQSNGIGSSSSSSSAPKGAGFAMGGKPKTLDDLIADKDKTGRANAMGGERMAPREFSAQDIINASVLQNQIDYAGINQ